jgi:hypothetical protein
MPDVPPVIRATLSFNRIWNELATDHHGNSKR